MHAAPFDPFDLLARLPGVTVKTTRLEGDDMGCYVHDERTVHLDDRLTAVEERCTAAHEAVHAQLGDECLVGGGPDGERLAQRQEARARRISAVMLLDVESLAEVLARSHGVDEAAEELHVDTDTLWTRLESLDDADKTYLQERIDKIEEGSWPTT